MKYSKFSIVLFSLLLVACNETLVSDMRVNDQSLVNTSQNSDEIIAYIGQPRKSIDQQNTITGNNEQLYLHVIQEEQVGMESLQASPQRNLMVSQIQSEILPVTVQEGTPVNQPMTNMMSPQPMVSARTILTGEISVFEQENRDRYDRKEPSSIKLTRFEPVSTFSTDVDTASYTNARRYLSQGSLPPAQSVRVEEFINYFDYHLNTPKHIKGPIHIETEIMQTPWNRQTQLMRVSLQAYRSRMDELPPLNLVFLLDVSGSMHAPDKLPLMQRSFNLLVNQLRPIDHVSIVVYAGASGVVLEPTSGANKTDLNTAINQLRAGGSTHGSAGIELAYQMAQKHFLQEGINRVILGTDGDFNVGTTSIDTLKDLITEKRQTGVFLNILGFGTGNYNDNLMEELSNHGNGIAYYIDSYQEARKIFSEQLTATLQTVAKDVKIQVEFNPNQVAEYRLMGYDNRQLKQEDFNNDKVDAGEMGSGHTVTALYEIVPAGNEFRFSDPLRYQQTTRQRLSGSDNEVAFVKVRYKLPESSVSELIDHPVTLSISGNGESESKSMALSAAVAGFAELLRNSPYVRDFSFDQVALMTKSTLSDDQWGYRAELLQLIKNAQSASLN